MNWIRGSYRPSERRLIVLAALVMLPVFFLPVLPIWTMKLWAPQYREGLSLVIYANTIHGDIDKINTLNHYVGMKAIRAEDFREFHYLPQALTAFGVLALLAALVNRRWLAVLGWLAFTGFSAYMFWVFADWLWRYGHELDPRAAITLDEFTPPLLGYQRMANFKVLSLPGPGTLLLLLAWALGPIAMWLEWREARRAARTTADVGTRAAMVLVLAWATALAVVPETRARTLEALPGNAAAVLAAAADGDTVRLAPGVHRGPLVVTRPIVVRGMPGAMVDGGGSGSVMKVTAAGAAVEDLTIQGSGRRVLTIDAGVRIENAPSVRLARLQVRDVLYGIAAERASGLHVSDCTLTGRVAPLDETGEGNGIHLWYTADAVISRCDVARFQDAIYLSFADRTHVRDSRLHDAGRYGLHTMYCQEVTLARSAFTRCVAGCAIMFSNGLRMEGNDFSHNRGSRTYGLLLRDCSAGTFTGNRLTANTVAMFLDNSNRNRFRDNLVQDNGWGVILFSSCAGNEFAANDFVQNDYPVSLDMRRTDNRFDDGRTGNYWSDNAPYDLDADGAADIPYSPVSAFSFLSKRYPDLAVLAKSPAVAALSVAERVLPALRPSEAVDGFPRLRPAADLRAGVGPTGTRGRVWPGVAGFGAAALLGSAAVVRGGVRKRA